jgi:peptidoglycan/xylan/chitin deacetylase (PgdA/CDA1 family)
MAGPAFSDNSPPIAFAARRRRLLLAVGAITLTAGLAPRLLTDRPRDQIPAGLQDTAARPPARTAAHHAAPAHTVPAHTVPAHSAAAHQGPAYPLDRPLYYVDDASRAIALTIDDGPDPVYTPQVLQVLREYHVTATFSMIGTRVAAYPHLARAVAEAGHQIANHTWTHANLTSMSARRMHSELTLTSQAVHAAADVRPALFRAPYGAWSPAVIRQCEQMKMIPLDWSVDPRDWARPGTRSIVRNIMHNTRPGSIILEHDGGGNRSETVEALHVVLPRLQHHGFRFVTP